VPTWSTSKEIRSSLVAMFVTVAASTGPFYVQGNIHVNPGEHFDVRRLFGPGVWADNDSVAHYAYLRYFVEEFYLKGYKDNLIESVGRMPTMMTVWMLNRVLNGTEEPGKRQALLRAMREAASNPKTDKATLERIHGFLERLSG
jgi:hypothetical protein